MWREETHLRVHATIDLKNHQSGDNLQPIVSLNPQPWPSPMFRRIALVTPILPMPFDPTRGRFIYETAKSLSRISQTKVYLQQARYPNISLLRPKSFVYGGLNTDYSLPDLDVDAYDYPAVPLVSRGINGLVSSKYLMARIKAFRPDVIIGYWVYPDGNAALRVARNLGIPCVIGALGSDIHLRKGINATMTRRTLDSADAVIVVSQAMNKFTQNQFGTPPNKIHTIVNGYNTSTFFPRDRVSAREALGIDTKIELITYVGRLIEAKGLLDLLNAFDAMHMERPNLRLAVIGTGVLEDQLKKITKAKNIGDKIWFLGGQPPETVALWLGASQASTLPSWSEGYPNVVVESIACGRPVVATDVGGTSEIIKHGENGLLVPAKDHQALRRALTDVLISSWDEAGIASGIHRSWDDVAAETLSVCEKLITRRTLNNESPAPIPDHESPPSNE